MPMGVFPEHHHAALAAGSATGMTSLTRSACNEGTVPTDGGEVKHCYHRRGYQRGDHEHDDTHERSNDPSDQR